MTLRYPSIDPVAIHLDPLPIRWYSLAYLAGFLIGWRYLIYIAGLDKDRAEEPGRLSRLLIDDFLPWAVLGVAALVLVPYHVLHVHDLWTPPPFKGSEAVVVQRLRALPNGARAISDDPGLVWRAGHATPPDFVDASILPDIPSVPTNVTTIMMAERIAARLSA